MSYCGRVAILRHVLQPYSFNFSRSQGSLLPQKRFTPGLKAMHESSPSGSVISSGVVATLSLHLMSQNLHAAFSSATCDIKNVYFKMTRSPLVHSPFTDTTYRKFLRSEQNEHFIPNFSIDCAHSHCSCRRTVISIMRKKNLNLLFTRYSSLLRKRRL